MGSLAAENAAWGAGTLRVRTFSLALAALGCTGSIDGRASPSGTGGGSPSAGFGGTTGPSSGAGSGTAGEGQGGSGAGAGIAGAGGVAGMGAIGSGGTDAALTALANPGNVVARRLSAFEYDNTVRDLLGTTLTPGTGFPADDLGGEFDNVGSALSLPPIYVKAYEQAAYSLVDDLLSSADSARKEKVVSCDVATGGDACASTILTAFARKAWRRPVLPEEVGGLMLPMIKASELGATPADGLRYALAGVLLSPFFIFKLEIDPDPAATAPRRLNAHELATRLSYALWSTLPDDTLSAAADAGALSTDAELSAQIDRMLADSKSDALLDGFAGQWLDFRELEEHEVEASAFPTFSPALVTSMQNEARRYFSEFLHTEAPLQGLMNGRFTFVDATLAAFYGVTRPGGTASGDFVRVDTTNANRAGLLTTGAFLMASSLANRTSVIRRGQYVYERMMCGKIDSPPPGIPAFPEAQEGLTARQLAEQHRADPACNGCHQLMDPIGFGLEGYDAIGAYRTTEGGVTIDTSGVLPDGAPFSGGVELADALASDPRFLECVTHKFTTYALGRLLDQKDDHDWITFLSWKAAQAPVHSLPALVRSVILSDAFRSRNTSIVK
jgi:hypothetical protein